MDVGKMIFYDKITGETLVDTGQWKNIKIKKTVDEQIATYKELSERNSDTFDVIELEYGAHSQEFAECNGYRVNLETSKLEFSYPIPGDPEAPQVFNPPLTEQIEELKIAQAETNTMLLEFMEATLLP